MRKFLLLITLVLIISGGIHAQDGQKPLIMPVALPPGPDTWLLGQPYGNTVGAYNFGDAWYSAGQGLHFGIDLSMPCGTPLVAVADGEVIFVDNLSFGSGPHNLLIRHDGAGVISLYGHLLERPPVQVGQRVTQGEVVAQSGDPDSTCVSRPHLHMEIRSLNYGTTYNPVDYIEANWHNLAIVGGFSYPLFITNLEYARQWVALEDQPEVVFGGRRLNAYNAVYPLSNDKRSEPNTAPARDFPAPDGDWTLTSLGEPGCCYNFWWHPTQAHILYLIDGIQNQRASVYQWQPLENVFIGEVDTTPPATISPDGRYAVWNRNGTVALKNLADESVTNLLTSGVTPTISPDGASMMWTTRSGNRVPGQADLPATIWVSGINGENARFILSGAGIDAQWLDASRILITTPLEARRRSLSVYDLTTNTTYELGIWQNMRGLNVAPGGERVMFYLTYQDDPNNNGIHVLETTPEATLTKLDWFGSWKWVDAHSVYYIPLQPETNVQTLYYYDVLTGENRALTDPAVLPFTVMNGNWEVSADGRSIAFQDATSRSLSVLTLSTTGE